MLYIKTWELGLAWGHQGYAYGYAYIRTYTQCLWRCAVLKLNLKNLHVASAQRSASLHKLLLLSCQIFSHSRAMW